MAEMLYRHSTTVYEYSLCWFVNVFSNFLILRTFITEKRYQKQGILFKIYPHYFLEFLSKCSFFLFTYVSINTKNGYRYSLE